MKLIEPAAQWRAAFLEMARECEHAGDRRYATALGDFEAYLQRIEARRLSTDDEDRVPESEFWLEHAGEILATARRIIEHNGGRLAGQYVYEENGKLMRKYWISA